MTECLGVPGPGSTRRKALFQVGAPVDSVACGAASRILLCVDKSPSDPSKANSATMKYQRDLAVGTHKATIIQRVRKIQVDSLLKLDRAPKAKL